jgi:hypothetical protein
VDDIREPTVAVGEEARQRYLEQDLRRLVDSGLALAKAETELAKARGLYAAGRIKWIVLLGALAAVLVFFALVALTVGLVVSLAPLIGAIWATLVVTAALLIVALVCGLIALRQWRGMVAALANRGAD